MRPGEDEIVQMLSDMPTAELSQVDRRRISEAVRAARPKGVGWWHRPMPAWQAIAACLLVAVCSAVAGRMSGGRAGIESTVENTGGMRTIAATGNSGSIEMGGLRAWMGVGRHDAYRMDVRRWRVLESGR